MFTIIEDKLKNAAVVIFLIMIFCIVGLVCYIKIQRNDIAKLKVQNDGLTILANHPQVIEKPVVRVRYITRTITKESEPQTLLLEKEVDIESNGGKEVIPVTGGNKPPEKNWTAGVTYDTEGNVGGLITRRVLGTIEVGVTATPKTAGVIGTIRF